MTKTLTITVIVILGALLLWFSSPAGAQGICFQFEKVLPRWAEKFKEIPVAGDVTGDPKFILFVSPDATFSIFTVNANGAACLIWYGNNWETFKLPVIGDDS